MEKLFLGVFVLAAFFIAATIFAYASGTIVNTSTSAASVPTTTSLNSTSTTTIPTTTVQTTTISTTTALTTTIPATIPANRSSNVANATRMLNSSKYGYEEHVLSAIGVSNSSSAVTPMNDTSVQKILASLASQRHSIKRIGFINTGGTGQPGSINISVANTSASIYYGSILNESSSKYFAAGSSFRYATLLQNGTLDFITVDVRKAPSSACIYINLAAAPFCSNATTPEQIHVPVHAGHYGLTNQTWYPLNVSFRASLIGNQTTSFNFSVIDITNGTRLTPLTTITSNGLNVNENFRISVTDSVEITVGRSGNANYTTQYTDPVTVPSSIIYYVPITLTNSQGNGVPNPY